MFPDAEMAMRTYLRTFLGSDVRVFFGFNEDAPFPQVSVARVGGRPITANAPLDEPMLDLQVRANSKAQAAQIAYAVMEAVESIDHPMQLMDGVVALAGFVIGGPVWSPDPDVAEGQQSRYVITATLQTMVVAEPTPA